MSTRRATSSTATGMSRGKVSLHFLHLVSPQVWWASSMSVLLLILSLMFYPPCTQCMSEKEAELQKLFQLRNEDEWKSAWHGEKHVRCRDQLLTHMNWACQKDIYRLDKKPSKGVAEPFRIFIRKAQANTVIKPWSGYIRRKREDKSITDECCSAAGCTWEEYAEYCPAHRRFRVSRSRT